MSRTASTGKRVSVKRQSSMQSCGDEMRGEEGINAPEKRQVEIEESGFACPVFGSPDEGKGGV